MNIRKDNKEIYWAWKSMKQRCQNPKCKAFRNYGARGITVCEEWQAFPPFCEWALSNGYAKGLDLDRINNDGNYSADNCRWIKRRDNINNRRVTTFLTVNGERLPRTRWEDIAGIPRGTVKMWVLTRGIEYAESRIADALKNGYKERCYSYGHTKTVVHVQSGMVFESVKEAAIHFGIAPCTISNAIKSNRSTGKGRFEWEEIG